MENLITEFEKLSNEEKKHFKNSINSIVGGDMKGKVAIVTGGNRGMGKCTVEKLAAGGATVVFTSSSFNEKAKELEDHITKTYGVECVYIPADCRKEEELNSMVDKVVSKFGRIDILVNNAGKAFVDPLINMSLENYNECIAINLSAPFILSKKVVPHMMKNKWGRIINISSGTTIKPQQALTAYMAAKAGLILISKGLALETGEYGITVNTIFPGPTNTDMLNSAIVEFGNNLQMDRQTALNFICQNNAVKKVTEPEDIANLIYFLCKEESGCITGANYACDYGFTC